MSQATQGRIAGIVPNPLPADDGLELLNAIYLQAAWTYPFPPGLTQPAPFVLRTGDSTTVVMMSSGDTTGGPLVGLAALTDGGVRVVDLPYGGDAYQMTIVLPTTAEGIDSLIPALTAARWSAWTATLDTSQGTTFSGVQLPRFTLTYGLELDSILSVLGMPSAFCSGPGTDFSQMVAGAPVCVSAVRHAATISVNEAGTVAAGVTNISAHPLCECAPPPSLDANHPFVFVIRERFSGTILFMGRLMNPSATPT